MSVELTKTMPKTLDDFLDAFEDAWSEAHPGAPPELRRYLPSGEDDDFAATAVEMMRVDMELRWGSAQEKRLAGYLTEHPWLRQQPQWLGQLAFEEYRLRLESGDEVRNTSYTAQFGVDVTTWPIPVEAERDTKALRRWNESTLDLLNQDADRLVSSIDAFPTIGDVCGDFTILELLGEGKFSRVYLAQQGELADRQVVLKISPELWSESEKLAQLQHTNIVPVFSIHRFGSLQGLCMPFFGRRTLDEVLLERSGTIGDDGSALFGVPLSPEGDTPRVATSFETNVCRFTAKLAAGLQHAHQRGVVHRDLKPANILVGDHGEPLILDFNLSEQLVVGGSTSLLVGGTLPYMAPEHLEAVLSRERLDERSDVYSLGVILYQVLTGKLPFPRHEGNFVETVARMLNDRRTDRRWRDNLRRHVSIDLVSIVEKSLCADIDQRYQSAEEFRVDLERHAQSQSLCYAPNRSIRQRTQKWLTRNRQLASFGSLSALAALLAACAMLVATWQFDKNRKLEATAAASAFSQQFEQLRMELALPDEIGGQRDETLRRAKNALAGFGVLEQSDWESRQPFCSLTSAEQRQTRQEIGELLFLVGDVGQSLELEHRQAPTGDEKSSANRPAGGTGISRYFATAAACFDGVENQPKSTRAIAFMRDNDFTAAGRLLAQAVQEDPLNPVLWLLWGNCDVAQLDYSTAEIKFTHCLALAPKSPRGYFNRGLCYLFEENFPAAESDFSKYLEFYPDSYQAFLNRAIAKKQSGDLQGALVDVSAAIDRMATCRAYLLRSLIRGELGQTEQSADDREFGIALTPIDALGWVSRGEAQLDTDVSAAIADMEMALQLKPRLLPALQNLAHIHADVSHDYPRATEALQRLARAYPRYAVAPAGMAVVSARQGQPVPAAEFVGQALKLSQDATTYYQAASAYAILASQSEKTDEMAAKSVELLRECFRLDPGWFATVLSDEDFAELRKNPECRRLLAAVNHLWED